MVLCTGENGLLGARWHQRPIAGIVLSNHRHLRFLA